ncbi:sensor histidine kinase [Alicyclobacillus mengziensis]|uniref:histidine kinase n=1 Tax=Alicyclobacillus mengziensis TaxID=2931921 RepID=A0A9X7W0Y4_9BACL|nr:HAMP domain-containing sensor histidine kinase [Alicyclobacillus mengziensis]QSO48696.1 HAMP domain-containing histidine kinase [Alicyclobacillus mengziensis]
MSIRTKLTLTLLLTVTTLILILALVLRLEMHQCFGLACEAVKALPPNVSQALQTRFDEALTQSLIWTLPGFILFVGLIVTLISRAFTERILWMRQKAVSIARGNLEESVPVKGKDELSSMAEALNYLSKELEKQEAFRKNLMQDVAHELRTPLMTLKSHIEAFIDGIWEPNPDRLRSCIEEVERFESLVKSVESLYEADQIPLVVSEHTDLREVAEQVVQMFVPRCENSGITLSFDAPIEPLPVIIHHHDLSQIVWNLLDNAVKYTSTGGAVHVNVGSIQNRSYVHITDTGIGIPEHELDNIFERFYRVDKSRDRNRGGSGLGLAIVKRLVERSNGKIGIESNPGSGTTFSIDWPR